MAPEILKAVAARVKPDDKNDHLLLTPESDDVSPYQIPPPREVSGIETCTFPQPFEVRDAHNQMFQHGWKYL